MWKSISGISLAFGMLAVCVADDISPKPSVSVEFCGRLRHGVMAIGGESTGTNISFNRIIWEVQLHNDADRDFAKRHHKKTVVVTGSLRKVTGIETKDRWVIDVKKLTEQDTRKDKEGIRMTILGKLRATNSRNPAAPPMAIDSIGQVWPIDFSSNAKLKAAAESLVGQSVFLVGSLKQAADGQPKAQPVIQVTDLKPPTNNIIKTETR